MGFLGSIGNFLGGIGNSVEDLFDPRKRQQQQQQAALQKAPASVSAPQNPASSPQPQAYQPDNAINLVPLQKAQPNPQQTAAQVGSQLGYDPTQLQKAKLPAPAPIEPHYGIGTNAAAQAAGGILSDLFVQPVRTVASTLDPRPLVKQWAGLLTGNREAAANAAQEQERTNPIFRGGAQFAQAADSNTTGEAIPHILGGLGETANVIGSGLAPMGVEGLVKAPVNLLRKVGAARSTEAAASELPVAGETAPNELARPGAEPARVPTETPTEAPTEPTTPTNAPAEPLKTPGEVAPGVTSANPNQAADAAAQAAQEAASGPATLAPNAPAEPGAPVEPAAPNPVQVQAAQPPAAPLAAQAAESPAAAAARAAEGQPVAAAVDANGNPALVSTKQAAQAAEAAGINPNPLEPLVPGGLPENPNVPIDTAGTPSGIKSEQHLRSAIRGTQDASLKAAYEASALPKNNPAYQDLMNNAEQIVGSKPLPQLITEYGGDAPIGNAQQYYERLQAISELEKHPDVPEARQAAADALSAMTDFESNNGYNLGATKIAYENMPTSMKVNYIQKLVHKAGGTDLPSGDLERLYNAADLQTKFAQTAQEAENAVLDLSTKSTAADPQFNDNMKTLLGAEQMAKGNLENQNRAVVDLLEKNLPKSDLGTRVAQNARTMMLSSIGGRAFALGSTAVNAAGHVADSNLSALYGKLINTVRGDNSVRSSVLNPSTLVKGAVKGFKGLTKEVFGSAPVKSVDAYVKGPADSEYSHDTTRYGAIGNLLSPLRKAIRFGVGSHLAATQGIEDAAIEQAARQAAVNASVPKENVAGFVDFYKAHPPQQVASDARQAWLGVNNLHQNNVSNALSKLASSLETAAGRLGGKGGGAAGFVAKQIRTAAMPFSHFMGGFTDKVLTDRNMIYNAYRITRARSPQELSDQLAHLTTNVGVAGGVGFTLAKSGVITDKDQDGQSYDGLYFHLGNKYIPVAIAGQAAMPIIMGARLQMNLANNKLASWPQDVANDALKTTGVAGTFGDTSSTGALLAGDTGRGAPQVAGTIVRQHIPGFFGDINSGLNYTDMNPTHEKPLTKATSTNPDTGKQNTDTVATEVNKTVAAIPGLSQGLPRQTGEQAPSFVDRMLHAGEASGQQVQAASLKKAADNQSAQDKAQGIPDPAGKYDSKKGESFDEAIKAATEKGDYQKAAEGLHQKLNSFADDSNVALSTKKDLSRQIKTLQVLDAGKYDPSIRDLYKTSLSEWRDMGDPKNDNYDPEKYQLLWKYDSELAKAGAIDKQKYSAKKPGSGSKTPTEQNTVGSPIELKKLNLGNLSPQKITNATIPTIQQITSSQLIKKRAISAHKGV